ncbi:endoplasmic reticulum lectin 1 isoform X3 [Hyposmocoma kahamanoa]|uniref:endoplasmic reticulum lectin 1 isoform X3 n=1 Tax=Hyposmocoma kahamanoa TaxID=1477025 RepID=UPI000E6D5C28|nr:endoplasmic reticulum lectin 1 isoform X3 [Hyposmocoma kahamanoa]
MKCTWFVVLCAIGIALCIDHDFKGFDDSILFGINWPGAPDILENLADGESNPDSNIEILKVTTINKEQYECKIPEIRMKKDINIKDYNGPSPLNLLKPLFTQKICSYRLESFWSYEVCHGRYIRQYHEDRDGKIVRTQEYYLGYWNQEKQAKLEAQLDAVDEEKQAPYSRPALIRSTKNKKSNKIDEDDDGNRMAKVEGFSLPFVELVMDDGTICDLSGKPRVTRVQYVCYSPGKHEVYSFKETSTCEYEIIILSPLLCEHPAFKPNDVRENAIDCLPVGDAPKKPRSLLKMEVENLRSLYQSIRLINNDGETHLKFELHPIGDESEDHMFEDPKNKVLIDKPPTAVTDDSPVRAFLNGEDCLNGGTGWWKYEFCYGKHVIQYHVDRAGGKTTLLLGRFSEEAHLEWIKEHKSKAPKPIDQRTSISHFYSNGDICDKTGKPRQTEVKLKCIENASNPAQVSLYLLEPRTCHYILGVESPLICHILPLADEHGLIKQSKPLPGFQEGEIDKTKEEDAAIKKDVPKSEND